MTKRHSKKRDQILEALKKEPGALSASELHVKLPKLNLTTIYRNLDTFVSDGIIRKIQLGSKEFKYEYSSEPHHHAVCEQCEQVIHFTAPDQKIIKLLGLKDFNVDELEVTVRGTHRHHS